MKLLSSLGAILAALISAGAGLIAIVAMSPISLVICLLGLILFFVCINALRRKASLTPKVPLSFSAPERSSVRPSDEEKLRRLAVKLGVEPRQASASSGALNENAAAEALRSIVKGRQQPN